MPPFDECCVLIPASTLEDFPAKLSDHDARSLLAGWTVLWHPQLLAQTKQIPSWYRADAPPDPIGRRLIVAPTASLDQLPEGYQLRAREDQQCQWILGSNRQELIAAAGLDSFPTLCQGQRSVAVEDFFAAGFACLQIQIMTRRLRYTSNLDEIHLQTRVVAAAEAFLAADAAAAIEALHDVIDALSEERDHYFTSDPHLIDLTLVTASTLDSLLQNDSVTEQARPSSSASADEDSG